MTRKLNDLLLLAAILVVAYIYSQLAGATVQAFIDRINALLP